MPEATLKFVARLAGVAPATVSRVLNRSGSVAAETREKVLAVIRDVGYTPNIHAANLRRKKLDGEGTSDLKERPVCPDNPVSAGCICCAFQFSSQDGRALVRQMVRLRRDVEKLRKHIERIQTSVDMIQENYIRQFFSGNAHELPDMLRVK
jgi:hypothetical protein